MHPYVFAKMIFIFYGNVRCVIKKFQFYLFSEDLFHRPVYIMADYAPIGESKISGGAVGADKHSPFQTAVIITEKFLFIGVVLDFFGKIEINFFHLAVKKSCSNFEHPFLTPMFLDFRRIHIRSILSQKSGAGMEQDNVLSRPDSEFFGLVWINHLGNFHKIKEMIAGSP